VITYRMHRTADPTERKIIQARLAGVPASHIAETLQGDFSDCDGGAYGYVRAVLDANRRDVIRP